MKTDSFQLFLNSFTGHCNQLTEKLKITWWKGRNVRWVGGNKQAQSHTHPAV